MQPLAGFSTRQPDPPLPGAPAAAAIATATTISTSTSTAVKRKSAAFTTPSAANATSTNLSAKVRRVATGFTTAKGSVVSISAESLQKAQSLFTSNDINTHTPIVEHSSELSLLPNHNATRTVSKTNLQVNTMSSTANKSIISSSSSVAVRAVAGGNTLSKFKTAKGSSVTISEKSLNQAQAFLHKNERQDFAGPSPTPPDSDIKSFRQIEAMSSTVNTPMVAPVKGSSSSVAGGNTLSKFKTAKGSSVTISEKSLNQAQAFLHKNERQGFAGPSPTPPDSDIKSSRQIEAMSSTVNTPMVAPVMGSSSSVAGGNTLSKFKTAKGSSVTISEKSLNQAQAFLHKNERQGFAGPSPTPPDSDIKSSRQIEAMSSTVNTPMVAPVMGSSSSVAGGNTLSKFKTAKGSSVTISEKSLNQAQAFLHKNERQGFAGPSPTPPDSDIKSSRQIEAMSSTVNTPMVAPVMGSSSSVAGGNTLSKFKTAKGSSVTISEKSLNQAQAFLHKNERQGFAGPSPTPPDSDIKSSRQIEAMSSTVNTPMVAPVMGSSSSVAGGNTLSKFKTAKGSSVTISEKSLNQAQAFLHKNERQGFAGPSPTPPDSDIKSSRQIEAMSSTVNTPMVAPVMGSSSSVAGGNTLSKFKTAKGSSVTISEKSLNQAQAFLHKNERQGFAGPSPTPPDSDIKSSRQIEAMSSTVNTPMVAPVMGSSSSVAGGNTLSKFKTAKGSSVTISEKSLNQAQAFLHKNERQGFAGPSPTPPDSDIKSSRQIEAMSSTVNTPMVMTTKASLKKSEGVALNTTASPVAVLHPQGTVERINTSERLSVMVGAILGGGQRTRSSSFSYSLSQMSQNSFDMPLAANVHAEDCRTKLENDGNDDLPMLTANRKRQLETPITPRYKTPSSHHLRNSDRYYHSSESTSGQCPTSPEPSTPTIDLVESTPRDTPHSHGYTKEGSNSVVLDTIERLKSEIQIKYLSDHDHCREGTSPNERQMESLTSLIGTPVLKNMKNAELGQVESVDPLACVQPRDISCNICGTTTSIENISVDDTRPVHSQVVFPPMALGRVAVDYNSLFGPDNDMCESVVTVESMCADAARKKRFSVLRQLNSGNILSLEIGNVGTGTFLSTGKDINPFEIIFLPQVSAPHQRGQAGSNLLRNVINHLSLVPLSRHMEEWVTMQLKWILWTLVAYERTRPDIYLGRLVTTAVVLEIAAHRFHQYTQRWDTDGRMSVEGGMSSTKVKRKFKDTKGSGSMSPLQRCVDIHTLVFPLVLCVAICPLGGHSNGVKAGKSGVTKSIISLTDGWWWVRAKVDADINTRLIDTGKLCEGDKIVVFAATFEESDDAPLNLGSGVDVSGHSGRTVMKLFYNAIRKAKDTAKVGCVPPKYLSRGLKLSTLLPSGGIVFSVRVTPKYISPLIIKVTLSKQSDAEGACKSDVYFMSTKEFDLFEKFHGAGASDGRGDDENALEELLEDNEELSLPYLIEHELRCEGWVREALLAIERGSENCFEFANEGEQQELLMAMDRVKRLQQDRMGDFISKERAREHIGGSDLNVTIRVTSFVDVLVSCTISSQSTAWIRCVCGADVDKGGAVQRDIAEKFSVGQTVFISHLRPGHGNRRGGVDILELTNSSNIKKVPSVTSANLARSGDEEAKSLSNKVEHIFDIRSVQATDCLPILDQTVYCTVVNVLPRSEGAANNEKNSLAYFEVHAIGDNFVTVLLKWPMTSAMVAAFVSSMNKERATRGRNVTPIFPDNVLPGSKIKINFGIITMYDDKHNILSMSRGEHTYVEVMDPSKSCSMRETLDQGSWRCAVLIQPTLPAVRWRCMMASISDTEKGTKEDLARVLDNERRRLISLRQGKRFYDLVSDHSPNTVQFEGVDLEENIFKVIAARCEACSRHLFLGAIVKLLSDDADESVDRDPHDSTVSALITTSDSVAVFGTPTCTAPFVVDLHQTLLAQIVDKGKEDNCGWSGGVADIIVTDRMYLDSDGGTSTRPTVVYIRLL